MKMKKTDLKAVCTEQPHDDGDQQEDVKPSYSVLQESCIELDGTESYVKRKCITAASSGSATDFKPISSIGCWDCTEDNDNSCASVAISTFSGMDNCADFSVNVVSNKTLE